MSRWKRHFIFSRNGGGATVVLHRIWLHPTLACNVVAGMSCSGLLRTPRLVGAAATVGRRCRLRGAADRRAATAVGPDAHHLAVAHRRTPDAGHCCSPGGCPSRLSAVGHTLVHNLAVAQRWTPAARRCCCPGGTWSRWLVAGRRTVHHLSVAQRRTPSARRRCCPGGCQSRLLAGGAPLFTTSLGRRGGHQFRVPAADPVAVGRGGRRPPGGGGGVKLFLW